jgi:hypothetical protein
MRASTVVRASGAVIAAPNAVIATIAGIHDVAAR